MVTVFVPNPVDGQKRIDQNVEEIKIKAQLSMPLITCGFKGHQQGGVRMLGFRKTRAE
jgi:hypothetical protein